MYMTNIASEKKGVLRDYFDWRIMKIYRTLIGQKHIIECYYGPFVPYVFENYYKSKKKILIVDQHTDNLIELKKSLSKRLLYDGLSLLTKNYLKGKKYKNTPFWNFSHLFNRNLNDGANLNFIWTNLIKINKYNQVPDDKTLFNKLVLPTLPLLYDEISVLNPDIILFLTGSEYDDYIRLSLPVDFQLKFIKIKNYNTSDFACFKINDIVCYRLCHPQYLKNNHIFDRYVSDLLETINKN